MDDLEAEMGRTLDEFIASLPKDERASIEARYRDLANDAVRQTHLPVDGDQKNTLLSTTTRQGRQKRPI
jgi:hypothetical protein